MEDMMEGDIMHAYMSSYIFGEEPTFEQLLTNHFAENVHISSASPSFFMMMFLGMNQILLMEPMRSRYNIEKVFYGWYPHSSTVKATILVNDNGMKIMKNRVFFLNKVSETSPRLLSEYEIHEMAVKIAANQSEDAGIKEIYENLLTYEIENEEYLVTASKSDPDVQLSRVHILVENVLGSKATKDNGTISEKEYAVGREEYKLLLLEPSNASLSSSIDIVSAYGVIYTTQPTANDEEGNIRKTLIGSIEIYNEHTKELNMSDTKIEAFEYAFAHGYYLALRSNGKKLTTVKTVQYTETLIDASDEIKPLREIYFLVLEPDFQSNINIMSKKVPTIVTFSLNQSVTPEMMHQCNVQNKIQSQILMIRTDYKRKLIKSSLKARPHIDFIKNLKLASDAENAEQSLETVLRAHFNEIQPEQLEQKLTDINYLSRHTLGQLVASNRKRNGFLVHEIRPQSAEQSETLYKLSLFHPRAPGKSIILHFDERADSNSSIDHETTAVDNFDTFHVQITQKLKMSKIDASVGTITRSITVHRVNSETFQQNSTRREIINLPIKDYLANRVGGTKIHTDLMNVLEQNNHLIIEPNLNGHHYSIDSASNFKAFIDGVFHGQPVVKNAIKLPQRLSSIQYTLRMENFLSHVVTYNYLYTSNNPPRIVDLYEAGITIKRMISPGSRTDKIFSGYHDSVKAGTISKKMIMITGTQTYFSCSIKVIAGRNFNDCDREKNPIENIEKKIKNETRINAELKKPKMPENLKQRLEIVSDVAEVCHYAGMDLTVHDLISSEYHRNKVGILNDVSFLTATAFSPSMEPALANKGVLIATQSKFSENAVNALGFGVIRAMSLYALYDFVNDVANFVESPNDAQVALDMVIDGAILITGTIIILAIAPFVVAAAPVVIAAAAAFGILLGGLNIYQAYESISYVEKHVELNNRERFDERFRALLGLDPAANIKTLISEEQANEHMKALVITFLDEHHDQFDVFVGKSGFVQANSIKMKENAVVDLRNERLIKISRASPKPDGKVKILCALHQEPEEVETPTFWTKAEDWFLKFMQVKSEEVADTYGFFCHNAFALQLTDTKHGKAAYYNLGNGDDMINGLADKASHFYLGKGKKYINGSSKNDVFMLTNPQVTGILDGSTGSDAIVLSSMNSADPFIIGANSSKLTLRNIEIVIGRPNSQEKVFGLCSFQTIKLFGGYSINDPDYITILEDCIYETTLYLDGNTIVEHTGRGRGNFTYVVNMAANTTVKVKIAEPEKVIATHTLAFNHTLLSLTEIAFAGTDDLDFTTTFTFENERNLEISRTSNQTMFLHFKDGCKMALAAGKVLSIDMHSDLSIRMIRALYIEKIRALGMPLIAYSKVDDETLMISMKSDKGPSIIHNSLLKTTSISIENCGDAVLLVNATRTSWHLSFPDINVSMQNCSCCKLIVDFNIVIEHLLKINMSENVVLYGEYDADDLLVFASRESENPEGDDEIEIIGKIVIKDAIKSDCSKNIIFRSYNDYSVLDEQLSHHKKISPDILSSLELKHYAEEYLQSALVPQPLVYRSNYRFIFLSALNTEWFNEIYINATMGRLEFYRAAGNTSLFITNMLTTRENESINLCSVFVENFYLSPKLATLTIRAKDRNLSLFDIKNGHATKDIDDLFAYAERMIGKYSSV